MIKVTLDTNCIINLLDIGSTSSTSVEDLTEILRYGLEGDVNIAVTTRVEADVDKDKDALRKSELTKRLTIFPVIGTIGRFDTSTYGGGDVFAGEEHIVLERSLKEMIFPGLSESDPHYGNKINDIDHLIGHKINNRDIFITDDKQILKKAETLKATQDIVIMSPAKALEYLNLNANRVVLIQEFHEKFLKYKDIVLKATFGQALEPSSIAEFDELRRWMILKYPKIKEGLFNFKFQLLASPTTRGNNVFNQEDLLILQNFNDRINGMFRERDVYKIYEIISSSRNNYGYISESDQQKFAVNFLNQFEDTLLGYIGKLSD